MVSRLPLLSLLLLVGPAPRTSPCTDAAPWDGIVGFLRAVSNLHDREPEPDLISDGEDEDNEPMRKIVYSVEEQVTVGDQGERNASVVIYDSLQDKGANGTTLDELKTDRERRSSEQGSERGSAVGVLPRPFLIGRKLWYVPLWFSLYLILYITALTVKSVARHRIKYPTLVSEDDVFKRRNGYVKPDGITRRVSNAISSAERQYQRQWSM